MFFMNNIAVLQEFLIQKSINICRLLNKVLFYENNKLYYDSQFFTPTNHQQKLIFLLYFVIYFLS